MILSLQFLEIDEIPVLLFDFLSSDTDYANQAMETNNFIQAMQTFSFGKIEGEDDNRLNWYFIYLKELKTQNHVKDLTVLILLENTYKL
jgi:hypothetical protein